MVVCGIRHSDNRDDIVQASKTTSVVMKFSKQFAACLDRWLDKYERAVELCAYTALEKDDREVEGRRNTYSIEVACPWDFLLLLRYNFEQDYCHVITNGGFLYVIITP